MQYIISLQLECTLLVTIRILYWHNSEKVLVLMWTFRDSGLKCATAFYLPCSVLTSLGGVYSRPLEKLMKSKFDK